jgi:hypothetical protein
VFLQVTFVMYLYIDLSNTEPVVNNVLVSLLCDLRCSEICEDDDGDTIRIYLFIAIVQK